MYSKQFSLLTITTVFSAPQKCLDVDNNRLLLVAIHHYSLSTKVEIQQLYFHSLSLFRQVEVTRYNFAVGVSMLL